MVDSKLRHKSMSKPRDYKREDWYASAWERFSISKAKAEYFTQRAEDQVGRTLSQSTSATGLDKLK